MQRIIIICLVFIAIFSGRVCAQVPMSLVPYHPLFSIPAKERKAREPQTKGGESEEENPQKNLALQTPSITISGLGTTQLTNSISPNLNVQMNIRPINSGKLNKLLSIPLNFNLGTSKDTVDLNSLTLTRVFYPDNSSLGFSGGIQLDILPLITKGEYTFNNTHLKEKNYEYFYVIPELNMSYRKIVLKSFNGDSLNLKSQIETFNFYLGIHIGGNLSINNNAFTLAITPYYKYQNVGAGTNATYQYIFKSKNDGNPLPNKIQDFGIQVDLQISKVQLSFSYDSPIFSKNASVTDPYLKSGVATLRATIVGDFLGFDF